MAVVTVCSCSSDSPYNFEPRLQTLPATDISRTEATLSGKCQGQGSGHAKSVVQLWQ